MRTLRATSLVLAFLAATGLVLGSFAFSAMSAERGVDVSVVADDEAYVGYENVSDGEIHPGEETPIARYHNRFVIDLDEFHVDVTVIDGAADVDVTIDNQPDGLDAGDGAYVNVTVDGCDADEEITFALDAEGSGAGVNVSFTREVELTCAEPESNDVNGVEDDGDDVEVVDDDGDDGEDVDDDAEDAEDVDDDAEDAEDVDDDAEDADDD